MAREFNPAYGRGVFFTQGNGNSQSYSNSDGRGYGYGYQFGNSSGNSTTNSYREGRTESDEGYTKGAGRVIYPYELVQYWKNK